jgi:hypothetical protein
MGENEGIAGCCGVGSHIQAFTNFDFGSATDGGAFATQRAAVAV